MDPTTDTKYGLQSEADPAYVPLAPAPPPGQALPGQQPVVQWMPQPQVRIVSACWHLLVRW